MDLIKQYSKKPEPKSSGKEQVNNNDALKSILNLLKSIFSRQAYIKRDTEDILMCLNKFNKLGVKSQIPFITPRQLYAMYTRGWSLDEMSAISGYSIEDIDKKLKSYNQNYVTVNK